jgi:hypothetical protein
MEKQTILKQGTDIYEYDGITNGSNPFWCGKAEQVKGVQGSDVEIILDTCIPGKSLQLILVNWSDTHKKWLKVS